MFDSPKLVSATARLPIFPTISLAAIFLIIIFVSSFVSNISLHSISSKNHHKLGPTSNDHDDGGDGDEDDDTNLALALALAPLDTSLPLTRQFDRRVLNFFRGDHQCSVQFFMTWISPAKSFGEREFLSVESLFKAHPNGCLIILSNTMDSEDGLRILKPLVDGKFRVLAVTPDFSFLMSDTPAAAWLEDIKSGKKDPGKIPLAQNLSNLLRLVVLYKYGGVYLDADVIVLRDFSGLRNSVGAQSVDESGNWTRLNNAVLVFDKKHPLLYQFIEEFATSFNGNRWGHNGPYLVSRVVERLETGKYEQFNFTVLPPVAFYPVDWLKIAGLFEKPANGVHSKWADAKVVQLMGAAYGVHLWNSQSRRLRIEEGSVIGRLISNSCVVCNHIYSSPPC